MRWRFAWAWTVGVVLAAGLAMPVAAQITVPLSCCPAGSGGGSGDVVGPASATDEAICRYDTTTGKLLQSSSVTLSDTTGIFTQTTTNGSIRLAANGTGFVELQTDGSVRWRVDGTNLRALQFGSYVGVDGNSRTEYNNGSLKLYSATTLALEILSDRAAWGVRELGLKGADVASAADITLGTGNAFDITGTTQINTIVTTNWTPGSIIYLQFDASVTVKHSTAGTGAVILLDGAADFAATAGDTLTLMLHESAWREIGRAVI